VRSLKAFVESAIALIFPSATTPPNANLIEHTPRQPIQKGRGNRVRKTHEYCEDWSAIVGLASDARRPHTTQGGRHKQPFDLGVRFVFGSANSRCRGITFTHVRAALCVSVKSSSTEVVNLGSQSGPHNRIGGAAGLRLRFG
jgi:hypothetical protein